MCPAFGLSLGDFARLDAACADANPFRNAVDQSLYRLQIYIPAAAGHIVRVRNVIAKLRPFAANGTNLCHGLTPDDSIVSSRLGLFRCLLLVSSARSG